MKEDTVERVRSAAWKLALSIAAPFAAVIASVYLIPDWLAKNAAENPIQLASFCLLAVIAGACIGIVVGTAIAGLGKQRSEDRLASVKEAEETKRRAKTEEEATKRTQIQADKELDLERMRNERADLERERERAQAEEEQAAEKSRLVDKIAKLPYQEAAALLSAIEEGTLERGRDDTSCLSLENSGLLIRLDTPKNVWNYTWKAADEVRSIFREENSVRSALANARHEEETRLERLRANKLRSEFESLDFNLQEFVYRLLTNKSYTIDEWKIGDFDCGSFVTFEKTGPGTRKAVVPQLMREFFQENDDLLTHVRKYYEQD